MTRLRILRAMFAILLIGAAPGAAEPSALASGNLRSFTALPLPPPAWRAPQPRQVRIEQHFSIRITPGPAVMPPSVIEELEEEERVEHVEVHKTGKCLPISSIATLTPGDGSELLLFLRDDRIIAATLEKRCAARDFYAGFYIEGHADGAICAGRDTLQSRSGANCKLRQLRELVRTGFRRFP